MIALSLLSSRAVTSQALAAGLIGALVFAAVPSAVAGSASAAPASAPVSVPLEASDPAAMGDYPAASFAAEAAALPEDLVVALERDADLTGAEYLAGAAAASDAASVLESLDASGVAVAGSHLDGTDLVVNVTTEADVAAVEATGAIADLSAPIEPDLGAITARFLTDSYKDHELVGGEAFVDRKNGFRCSLAFNGRALSNGKAQTLTAGHCKEKTTTEYHFLNQTSANRNFGYVRSIGVPLKNSFRSSGGYDAGLIALTNSWYTSPAAVSVWDGASGEADSTIPIYDRIPAVRNATVCKSGATTGWTCGVVLAVDYAQQVEGQWVNSIVTTACTRGGDSGGAAVVGNAAVGVVSWGTAGATCTDDDVAGFFPMISTNSKRETVTKRFGKIWEPTIAVGRASITTPADGATVGYATRVSGNVPFGTTRNRVVFYVDGKLTTLTAKVTSAGNWSTKLIGVPAGTHVVQARAYWGKYSRSSVSVPVTVTVTEPPIVTATTAENPTTASVELSRENFPGTTNYAFVAVSTDRSVVYAASAAAEKRGAPVFLIPRGKMPKNVAAELQRLGVTTIYLAGSTSVLTPATLKSLKKYGAVAALSKARLNAYTLR